MWVAVCCRQSCTVCVAVCVAMCTAVCAAVCSAVCCSGIAYTCHDLHGIRVEYIIITLQHTATHCNTHYNTMLHTRDVHGIQVQKSIGFTSDSISPNSDQTSRRSFSRCSYLDIHLNSSPKTFLRCWLYHLENPCHTLQWQRLVGSLNSWVGPLISSVFSAKEPHKIYHNLALRLD